MQVLEQSSHLRVTRPSARCYSRMILKFAPLRRDWVITKGKTLNRPEIWTPRIANASAPGPNPPKSGKEGFGVKKLPFPSGFESQNPHFPCGALYRNGDFLTQSALSWGNGSFLTPKPSFPDFGEFGIVGGGRVRNPRKTDRK